MNTRIALATVRRVLVQLRHDHRTVALMLAFPTVLMVILRFVFNSDERFGGIAPALLGIFPFTVMFLVTSVSTLRERRGGTLERLMTMPMGRGDFLIGYGVGFSLLAVVQVAIVSAVTMTWLGLDVAGSVWVLLLIALLDALLGTALGLGVSAFARTEFQAVQFLPVVVLPQVLLCGLFTDRGQMAPVLEAASNVLPLTYAVEAVQIVTRQAEATAELWIDVAVVLGSSVLALTLGALTLSRQSR
ncbi:ABC transporter permease [Kineococcus arenarius]|uniref:ABC transporter permease n=1 Tax=unclassified Kineococcus TaxID=2621656 RepID=UPI003D7D505A